MCNTTPQFQTIAQLVAAVQRGLRPIVIFNAGADVLETYAEANIRARVIGAQERSSEESLRLHVDYSEFDALNASVETSTYYDKSGEATLNARQAGYYRPQEWLVFGPQDDLDHYMALADDSVSVLHARFVASGTKHNYVGWLEEQVLAAC